MTQTEIQNIDNNVVNIENKQSELIKSKYAKNASKEEFDLLLYMAEKYKLDILTGQLQFVKYGNNPASIFCGRDGFLSIAHRSGNFDGMETEIGSDGSEIFAVCKVYRKDMERAFSVKVYLSEYTRQTAIWKEKPRTMLSKVAESQCLRKAFDISGLYDRDEMLPVNEEKEIDPIDEMPNTVKDLFSEMFVLSGDHWSKKKVKAFCNEINFDWISISETLKHKIEQLQEAKK